MSFLSESATDVQNSDSECLNFATPPDSYPTYSRYSRFEATNQGDTMSMSWASPSMSSTQSNDPRFVQHCGCWQSWRFINSLFLSIQWKRAGVRQGNRRNSVLSFPRFEPRQCSEFEFPTLCNSIRQHAKQTGAQVSVLKLISLTSSSLSFALFYPCLLTHSFADSDEEVFVESTPKKQYQLIDLTGNEDETSNGAWKPRPEIMRSRKYKCCSCFSPGEEVFSFDKRYWIVIQSNEKNTMRRVLKDVQKCVPDKESVEIEFHCPTPVDDEWAH